MRPHRHLGELLILFGQGAKGLAVLFGDGLVRLLQHLARFFPEIVRIVRRWRFGLINHVFKPGQLALGSTPYG
jgi:hypothetical protein